MEFVLTKNCNVKKIVEEFTRDAQNFNVGMVMSATITKWSDSKWIIPECEYAKSSVEVERFVRWENDERFLGNEVRFLGNEVGINQIRFYENRKKKTRPMEYSANFTFQSLEYYPALVYHGPVLDENGKETSEWFRLDVESGELNYDWRDDTMSTKDFEIKIKRIDINF